MPNQHVESLISRIIDGDASESDWSDLRALAENEPPLWRRLAEAQRDHAELVAVMNRAATVADEVPVSVVGGVAGRAGAGARTEERGGGSGESRRFIGAWVGWAAAAVILLAWTVRTLQMPPLPETGQSVAVHEAGLVPIASAQDAFDEYIARGREEGRVLSDRPRRVLLQTRRNPAGDGYELIYLQQIMEKTVVPDLYRFGGQDERGQPSLVRYTKTRGRSM